MSRYEIVREWNESDLPFEIGITGNRIHHCILKDYKTDLEEEGTGWSEDEAYNDAVDKLERAIDDYKKDED